MKTLLIGAGALLLSAAAISQTATEESSYSPSRLIVSGTNFEEITGCWARLYERENLEGRALAIVGYTTVADLEYGLVQLTGVNNTLRTINSLEVGPQARLVLYGQPNFFDQEHVVSSAVTLMDLPTTPGGGEPRSLKLLCDPD